MHSNVVFLRKLYVELGDIRAATLTGIVGGKGFGKDVARVSHGQLHFLETAGQHALRLQQTMTVNGFHALLQKKTGPEI